MANQSEKNAQKKYTHLKALYMQIILALTVIYVLVRVIYCWDSFTFINWVGFAMLTAVNFFGYKLLMGYLALGHPRSSYSAVEEILWVNWFIMVTTMISEYFWFFYLLVPGYAIYRFGPMVMGYIFPNKGGMMPGMDQMQEQPEQKQKVKYMRR